MDKFYDFYFVFEDFFVEIMKLPILPYSVKHNTFGDFIALGFFVHWLSLIASLLYQYFGADAWDEE